VLESAVQRVLVNGVKALGGMTAKLDSSINVGVPDLLVLLPDGRFWLVEVKQGKGHLRPVQRAWIQKASTLGHTVYVLHGPVEVRRFLKEIAQ
jgi:hypothetical protein